MSVRIMTVIGARPQFIKAAAVGRILAPRVESGEVEHVLLHTGQHYDANMSAVFFDELNLPAADINLGISASRHGAMTGAMLAGVEEALLERKPDWMLVYGDTNSTLAGALAAVKHHVPVAHVEAGLRSFNRQMPEEINRVLTDHAADLLLCPTKRAVDFLAAEGIQTGVSLVGDVMFDLAMLYASRPSSQILESLGLAVDGYVLVTCHRAENTDDPIRLTSIIEGLRRLAQQTTVVLPMHPRTKTKLQSHGLKLAASLCTIDPVGYADMLELERNATMVVTDSGGVQKEAYMFGVPCVTLREETEWQETVDVGWNVLVGTAMERVEAELTRAPTVRSLARPSLFGDGHAAEKVVALLLGEDITLREPAQGVHGNAG